ncbi:MAG: enoyl-CoA hydratase [Hyphomicrobium sp.]
MPQPEPLPAAAIRLTIEAPLAWVVIDNAARTNALTASMWQALAQAFSAADADPAVRVVVIRGAGTRAFSAGADISEFETARSGEATRHYDALNEAAFNAISATAKPTIAMVHGFCLGGGLAIAACCDLRLADEAASFAIPATRLGIGYNPRWVRPLLALTSGPCVKELLFTGRRLSAAEALAMGLVNRTVAASELEAATRALASEIAGNAPLTIRAAKLTIDELIRHPERPDTRMLDAAVQRCFDSEDYAEGRRAFLEKRRPNFQGR